MHESTPTPFCSSYFFSFPFVVTMPRTDSSNTHPALASAFKSVYLRRCTGWQTDSRGRYLRCCIEYIFGSSLPVTVETPSIQQRWGSTQLPTPTRLTCLMLPRRGRSWDGGGKWRKTAACCRETWWQTRRTWGDIAHEWGERPPWMLARQICMCDIQDQHPSQHSNMQPIHTT